MSMNLYRNLKLNGIIKLLMWLILHISDHYIIDIIGINRFIKFLCKKLNNNLSNFYIKFRNIFLQCVDTYGCWDGLHDALLHSKLRRISTSDTSSHLRVVTEFLSVFLSFHSEQFHKKQLYDKNKLPENLYKELKKQTLFCAHSPSIISRSHCNLFKVTLGCPIRMQISGEFRKLFDAIDTINSFTR